MTLDNDTGHFPPSPPQKSYNPFDSDDDTLDSPGLKPENVYTKEDQIGFNLKELDESSDALNFCMENGDLSWEEAVFGQPAVNSCANGHHTSLFEKDGQLYTDKNVTECELPEIVVCYKENNYHSVKDIGIDEGVPIHDKIWVQSCEDEIKDSSSLLALIRKGDDAMNTEKRCPEVDVVETPKSKLNEEVVNGQNLAHEFGDEDCLKINEVKLGSEDRVSFPANWATTTVDTDPKKNESKQGEPDLIGEDGPNHDDTIEKKGNNVSPDEVDNDVVQEPTTGEISSDHSTEYSEATIEPDKSPNEDKNLPNSSKDLAVQEPANASAKDESENVETAKPPSTQSMTRQEEATSTNSAVFSLEPRNHGETSFSSNVSVPLPSSITFTGPVAYSGNVSYRSESSAGSTRSFAFPILQTEWNSSPERMVKADQRHLRKQKGWVQALICCRF